MKFGARLPIQDGMTATGGLELGLLGLQVLVSIASAYAGMRIVDDIRYIRDLRSRGTIRDR